MDSYLFIVHQLIFRIPNFNKQERKRKGKEVEFGGVSERDFVFKTFIEVERSIGNLRLLQRLVVKVPGGRNTIGVKFRGVYSKYDDTY